MFFGQYFFSKILKNIALLMLTHAYLHLPNCHAFTLLDLSFVKNMNTLKYF